jgi:Phage tail protein RIFT-related domain
MLTEVKAYSSWQSAPTLALDDNGSPETDLVQIRNIEGLDPIKASVGTSGLGSVDGSAYTGSSILSRNIVLTVHPNPDWDNWSYEKLRKLLYAYFMPKRPIRLVFESDDMPTVEISGIVESAEASIFSKDPELIVSIICPDPYFTAVDPEIITGQSVRPGGAVHTIDYNGTVETGLYVKVSYASGTVPNLIGIQVGDPAISYCNIDAGVSSSMYFELNSIPLQKFVHNVTLGTGVITNLLSKLHITEGSAWPFLEPGETDFSVITNTGVQDWELRYYERFGGL